MRVSVDIDDVVIDFTAGWQPIYENYFGIEVKGPVSTWEVFEYTHFETKAEFFKWWEKIDGWAQLGWVPGARGALDSIYEREGWSLAFTTARWSDLSVTHARKLGGRGGLWPNAVVNTRQQYKASVLADIHIDDGPHIAQQFAEADKLMILFDRPWNQNVEAVTVEDGWYGWGDFSVIARAHDWAEVMALLELV